MFRPLFKSTAKTLQHLDSRKVLFKEKFQQSLRYLHGIYFVKTQLETALPMPFGDDPGVPDKRREQF